MMMVVITMMMMMTRRVVSGSDRSRDNQVQGHKHNKHNMCTPDSYHDDHAITMMMMMAMMMILYDDPVMTITIHSHYDDML